MREWRGRRMRWSGLTHTRILRSSPTHPPLHDCALGHRRNVERGSVTRRAAGRQAEESIVEERGHEIAEGHAEQRVRRVMPAGLDAGPGGADRQCVQAHVQCAPRAVRHGDRLQVARSEPRVNRRARRVPRRKAFVVLGIRPLAADRSLEGARDGHRHADCCDVDQRAAGLVRDPFAEIVAARRSNDRGVVRHDRRASQIVAPLLGIAL